MARRRPIVATCVRRTRRDEHLTHTYYRVSGEGLQVMAADKPAKFYNDVVVSTYVDPRDGRGETIPFAANKNGKIKHTSRGHLIQLWGGQVNTTSAEDVLKNAGATKIVPCSDGMGRSRHRRKSRSRR